MGALEGGGSSGKSDAGFFRGCLAAAMGGRVIMGGLESVAPAEL